MSEKDNEEYMDEVNKLEARHEALRGQVWELEGENKEWEKSFNILDTAHVELRDEMINKTQQLEAKNEKLTKGLEHYADKAHWYMNNFGYFSNYFQKKTDGKEHAQKVLKDLKQRDE